MTSHRISRHEKPELGDFKEAATKATPRRKAAERETRTAPGKAEKSQFRTQISL